MTSTCIDRERASTPGQPGTEPLKVLYTVVRKDLPHGVQLAQVKHAATEALGYPPTIAVALHVPDEATLREIAKALGENSLTHVLIIEDAGPYAGQATAVGLAPLSTKAEASMVIGALPLAR